LSESCFHCKKNTKFDHETVSLLCVKTKSGAHKQQTIISTEGTFLSLWDSQMGHCIPLVIFLYVIWVFYSGKWKSISNCRFDRQHKMKLSFIYCVCYIPNPEQFTFKAKVSYCSLRYLYKKCWELNKFFGAIKFVIKAELLTAFRLSCPQVHYDDWERLLQRQPAGNATGTNFIKKLRS
jgi:hypothetical protein